MILPCFLLLPMIHQKKAPLQSKAVEPLLQIFLLLIRPVIRRMPSALSRPASSESLLNSPVSEYTRVRAPLAVRCKGICCHRKNRNIIVLTHTVSNFFRRLDAIHHRNVPYLRSWLPFYRPCSFASQPFDCFAEILFLF